MRRLYWRDEHIGNVTGGSGDQPGFWGTFELVTQDETIIDFLQMLVDESRQDELNDSHEHLSEDWTLVSDDGATEEIWMPAVHLDRHEIWWQSKLP